MKHYHSNSAEPIGAIPASKICDNFLQNSTRAVSLSPDSKPTPENQAGQVKAIIQLDFFDAARPPRLRFQKVPKDLAIAPNRFFLSIEVAGGSWLLPIQLTSDEVEQLLKQAQVINGGVKA